ncbi:MAG: hypothetical protein KDA46_14975, partial [Parvularculaceae bacterium]|nr:hypothetical protein [Parvularculaceae bacterium]
MVQPHRSPRRAPAGRVDNQTSRRRRFMKFRALLIALTAFAVFALPDAALAQSVTLDLGEGGGFSARIIQLVLLMTVLSLAPSIL